MTSARVDPAWIERLRKIVTIDGIVHPTRAATARRYMDVDLGEPSEPLTYRDLHEHGANAFDSAANIVTKYRGEA